MLPSISTIIAKAGQTLPSMPQVVPVPNTYVIPVVCQRKPITNDRPTTKAKFTPQEDMMLVRIMLYGGIKNWNEVANIMQTRNARQCRDRWNNYLNPYLRNDEWTESEDRLLLEKYKIFGTQWRKIALFFRNRSDNSLRNRCQLLLRRMERGSSQDQSLSSSSDQN